MKRTPWFPVSVKPVRNGRYEIRHMGNRQRDRIFTNGVWLSTDGRFSVINYMGDSVEWRGLTEPYK
jgi:hypothetical protein